MLLYLINTIYRKGKIKLLSSGYSPIPGSVHDQAEWDFEKPGLVEGDNK